MALASPATAVTLVGAAGTEAGVTGFDGAESGPLPAELVAYTTNVYVVPLVRPVSVVLVVFPFTVRCAPPGAATTVYEEIAAPPLELGAVHEMVA